MKSQIALIVLFLLLFAKVEGTAVRKPSKCNEHAGKSDGTCTGCLTTVHAVPPAGEEFTTVFGEKKKWTGCQWDPNAKGAKRCRMVILNEGFGGEEGYIGDQVQCPEVLEAKALDSIGELLRRPGAHNPKALVKHSGLAADVAPGPWGKSRFVYRTRLMQHLTRNDGYCWRFAASQTFGLPFALFNQLTHSMINSDAAVKSNKQSPSYKSYDSNIPGLKSMWENMNKPLTRTAKNGLSFDEILRQIKGLASPHVVGQIEQDVNIDFKLLDSDDGKGKGKHALAARLACTRLGFLDSEIYSSPARNALQSIFLDKVARARIFLQSNVFETRVIVSVPGHTFVLKMCKGDEHKLCYVDVNGISWYDGQEMPWDETMYSLPTYDRAYMAGQRFIKIEWCLHCDKAYMAGQERIEAVLNAKNKKKAIKKMKAIVQEIDERISKNNKSHQPGDGGKPALTFLEVVKLGVGRALASYFSIAWEARTAAAKLGGTEAAKLDKWTLDDDMEQWKALFIKWMSVDL